MPAADGYIQVPPDSTGKKIDTSELAVGVNTVERQRLVISDPTTAANLALVDASGNLYVAVQAFTTTQGGTSSGQTGPLMLAAATDNPIAALDGQMQALSVNSEGRLRVSLGAGSPEWFTEHYDTPVPLSFASEGLSYV